MQTRAVWRGDRYVLNGEKWFVTVGDVADFILTMAWVDDKPTLFIVDQDAPGVVSSEPRVHPHLRLRAPEFTYTTSSSAPSRCSARSARVTS